MKGYEILNENEDVVKFRYQDLTYTVRLMDNSLVQLKSSSQSWVNAKIPHTLPSGHRIDTLSPRFIPRGDRFNEIIISKGIQIQPSAFADTWVHRVVWPEDCKVIPKKCFSGSKLEEISNIQNVEVIEECAFEGSSLREMSWPDKCEIIPDYCFFSSGLRRIANLDVVRTVGKEAFSLAIVECLDFSGANNVYFEKSSLVILSDTCKVILPYYVDESNLAQARTLVLEYD